MLRKKLLILVTSLTIFSTASFAKGGEIFRAGPYMGLQAGYSEMHYRDGDFAKVSDTTADSEKIAGRIYGGYSFTNHLGLELGYTYYGNPTFSHPSSGLKEDFLQQGVDLSFLISLTFDYGLGFYLKGGDTLIHRGSLKDNAYFIGRKSSMRNVLLFGVGVLYDFFPNWSLEGSWTQTNSSGNLPRSDFYSVGFVYRFD